MQTTLSTDILLSNIPERSFQLSTHIRPVSPAPASSGSTQRAARMPALSHLSSASAPADYLARDVSSRFGARLRELRRERNLTQLRMANDFGIDRSFISDVERGRKSISLPMLEVIALGMKLSLSDLLQDI